MGGIGIGVQLAVLAVLKSGLHLGYLMAAALAVETAVIHNLLWHQKFTWVGRTRRGKLVQFVKFNLSTGAFSIAGNLVLMKGLVDGAGLPYFPANLAAIAGCSLVNFFVSDRFVFQD